MRAEFRTVCLLLYTFVFVICFAGFGNVKAVLSGDTVVLLGAAKGSAPPPEMQLSLSHLSAPRVSRHPEAKDEVSIAWLIHAMNKMRATLVCMRPCTSSCSFTLPCTPAGQALAARCVSPAALRLAGPRVPPRPPDWQAGTLLFKTAHWAPIVFVTRRYGPYTPQLACKLCSCVRGVSCVCRFASEWTTSRSAVVAPLQRCG